MWELPPRTVFVISSSHICALCLCADCRDCSGGQGVRGLQGEALLGARHWQRLAFASKYELQVAGAQALRLVLVQRLGSCASARAPAAGGVQYAVINTFDGLRIGRADGANSGRQGCGQGAGGRGASVRREQAEGQRGVHVYRRVPQGEGKALSSPAHPAKLLPCICTACPADSLPACLPTGMPASYRAKVLPCVAVHALQTSVFLPCAACWHASKRRKVRYTRAQVMYSCMPRALLCTLAQHA